MIWVKCYKALTGNMLMCADAHNTFSKYDFRSQNTPPPSPLWLILIALDLMLIIYCHAGEREREREI
jgi:hypothetical protein